VKQNKKFIIRIKIIGSPNTENHLHQYINYNSYIGMRSPHKNK